MYTEHYSLTEPPFQLTPDPRFFYLARSHRRAIAYLRYGLRKTEGFIVITGDIGTGKTTLLDYLCGLPEIKSYRTARIVLTSVSADDLTRMVAQEFGINHASMTKAGVIKALTDAFLSVRDSGPPPLLLVDEVQNLSAGPLEELRMLSNFYAAASPLLQICLVGQPQFLQTLADPGFEQLRQRVVAACHLVPLTPAETRQYIEYRLNQANWRGEPRIADDIYHEIYGFTQGVPRRINVLCDRLFLFGYLNRTNSFDNQMVRIVADDITREMPLMETDPSPHSKAWTDPIPPATHELENRIAKLERDVRDYKSRLAQLLSL